MLLFLLNLINVAIFDYTIPRLFETIDDYAKYNPNIFNYDLIHKDFTEKRCFETNQYRLNECIKFSMKKFYKPFSKIPKNKSDNSIFQLYDKTPKKQKKAAKYEEKDKKYEKFWFKCAFFQNKANCAELFDTFNFFNTNETSDNYIIEHAEQRGLTIFSKLREAHNLMYKIDQNGDDQQLNENGLETRESRFRQAYEILKPIAFLAFEKYITDHFGSLIPLHRFNSSLVEENLGSKQASINELKILLDGKEIQKDPSWMFSDLMYPEVARLLKHIVTKRDEKPEFPLNEIYSNFLDARYPYIFDKQFKNKENFIKYKTHYYNDSSSTRWAYPEPNFDDFFIGENLFWGKEIDIIEKVEKSLKKPHAYTQSDDDYFEEDNKEIFVEYNTDEDEENEDENQNENDVPKKFDYFYDDERIETESPQIYYDIDFSQNNNDSKIYTAYRNQKVTQNFKNSSNNYLDEAHSKLSEAFKLCRNYLYSIENIENLNQSNLTIKIATIYGIEKLFNRGSYDESEKRIQFLQKVDIFDIFDEDGNLTKSRFVDEGIYYLMIAAQNGGIKAAEALIFKFLKLMNETNDKNSIDNYFQYVLNEFSDFYDERRTKSDPPNFYVHFNNRFQPLVQDFFDSIIFFDHRLRDYFQIDRITEIIIENSTTTESSENSEDIENSKDIEKVKIENNNNIDDCYFNPRNWTYEDAAKALRRFIDASFLVQSGHYAEYSLSCQSGQGSFSQKVGDFFMFNQIILKSINFIYNKVYELISYLTKTGEVTQKSDKIESNEIILNEKKINKKAFLYSLRVYQTLAMSGNRDAMWNTQILMKAAWNQNQNFMMFITDSNETVFLHELDVFHRKSQMENKTIIFELLKEEEKLKSETMKKNDDGNNRSIRFILSSIINSAFDLFGINNKKKSKINMKLDSDFYEEISDLDPYAAFSLAWEKRNNLSAAYELLNKTENMKPEAKVAVIISKMIITTLSFFDSVFNRNVKTVSHSNALNSSSSDSFSIISSVFELKNFEKMKEVIKSTSYLPEFLLGFGILAILSFLIYIRISLYCD